MTGQEYEFKQLTHSEYECVINLSLKSKIVEMVFAKAKTELLRKKGISVGDRSVDEINSFDVPHHYYQVLATATRGFMKEVRNQVKQDGVKLLTFRVSRARFTRVSKEEWQVSVYWIGDMVNG